MRRKKSVWVWVLLGLVVTVLCVALYLAAAIGIPALLCSRETRSPQVVDVSPWLTLTWRGRAATATDLDLTLFDSYKIVHQDWSVEGTISFDPGEDGNANESYLQVRIEVWDNSHLAEKWLREGCDSWAPGSELKGNEKGRYCISYAKEATAGPEGLCRPFGLYNSYVVLQKDNVLITIHETTKDKESRRKDEVIRWLAEELVK